MNWEGLAFTMTKKLYWERPYETEFKATIVDIGEDALVLDQTLFFPESGGQAGDTGVIKVNEMELTVTAVSKEGDTIIHHVEPYHGCLEIEDEVTGFIDWERRHELMKAHTSQHVLSAVILRDHGVKTSRVAIKPGGVELELDQRINLEKWADAIERASIICTTNHAVETRIIPLAETTKANVRGAIPEEDPIRILEVEGIDAVCCGGTHVANTIEIGPIYAYNIKKNKTIEYYTGFRGLSTLARNNVSSIKATRAHNKNALEVAELIDKLADDKKELGEQYKALVSDYLALVSKKPDFELQGISFKVLKTIIDKNLIMASFKKFPPDYLLVIDRCANTYMVLSSCSLINANELLQKMLDEFGGKGGGNPKVAQGKLNRDPPDLREYIQESLDKD